MSSTYVNARSQSFDASFLDNPLEYLFLISLEATPY